jgi:hypothetical protein
MIKNNVKNYSNMKTSNEIIPVEVFSGKIWEAEMVKSLLENAEIQVFLKDEINGTLTPWVVSPGGLGSVKVVVSNLDFDNAKKIVDEYEKNTK